MLLTHNQNCLRIEPHRTASIQRNPQMPRNTFQENKKPPKGGFLKDEAASSYPYHQKLWRKPIP